MGSKIWCRQDDMLVPYSVQVGEKGGNAGAQVVFVFCICGSDDGKMV